MILNLKLIYFGLFVICVKYGETLGGDQRPYVKIPSLGEIKGNISKSHFTKRPIYEFYGINYAKAPSGERRFKPPEPSGAWSGLYNATKMRQKCPQVDLSYYPSPDPGMLDVKEDLEDCLVVNVFTPKITSEHDQLLLPVMFYIHGGSFYLGSAYDFLPNFLLEEDIVLVVPQYRLGPLGFLSLGTPEIPGNMGMLDIILALRWVKNYIRYFGGDHYKITVVGQSAGGAAASSLLLSPLVEKGLFDKMIIQSGSVLGSWPVDNKPLESAQKIGQMAGCPISLNALTECLKKLHPMDLVKAHFSYVTVELMNGDTDVGGASLVIQEPRSGGFLVKHPRVSFSEGFEINIPVLGGVTRDEGSSFLSMFYDGRKLKYIPDKKYLERNITQDLIRFFGYDDSYGLLTDSLHNMYFPGEKNWTLDEMLPGLVDMSGVLLIKQSTYNVLRSISYKTKTFVYSFNFYGGISKLRASMPNWDLQYPFPPGVAHSDELGYLFPALRSTYRMRELKMVRTMVKFWTNFVKYGDPDPSGGIIKWPQMTSAQGPYLRISDELEVRKNFLNEFMVASREGFIANKGSKSNKTILRTMHWSYCFCILILHLILK